MQPLALNAHKSQIVSALSRAAERTGADFDYLLATAKRESGLETDAKSKTSSATGLFQFIDKTWFSMVKQRGAEIGLGHFADAIKTDSTGRHSVPDEGLREEILALRHDADISATMAGFLTSESADLLRDRLGREPSSAELYTAHFLGAGRAVRLIGAAESDPSAIAASLFPRAAEANRPIFYDDGGRARSVREVVTELARLHAPNDDGSSGSATVAAAVADGQPRRIAPAPSIGLRPTIDLMPDMPAAPATSAPASQALRLTPFVIEVLASLEPLGKAEQKDDDRRDSHAASDTFAQPTPGVMA